jgi:hypothetical protein
MHPCWEFGCGNDTHQNWIVDGSSGEHEQIARGDRLGEIKMDAIYIHVQLDKRVIKFLSQNGCGFLPLLPNLVQCIES